MFSSICAWMNGWVYNREAGYLRRHRAHYDVIVMEKVNQLTLNPDMHEPPTHPDHTGHLPNLRHNYMCNH